MGQQSVTYKISYLQKWPPDQFLILISSTGSMEETVARGHGAQDVCQHFWHLLQLVALGNYYTCCIAMHLLELLNVRIR